MKVIANPWRGSGLPRTKDLAEGTVSTNAAAAAKLYTACPKANTTPLLERRDLATAFDVSALHLKDERARMGLGSFKALGAAYTIAKRADAQIASGKANTHETALSGVTFACASAGNHGLSLAAGAPLFGAKAVVFIAETVPEAFAERLRAKGADVIRAGTTYEEGMAEAKRLSAEKGWHLLPDSTWPGETDAARDVMEGYLIMGTEIAIQMAEPPTHIFLQAGVGGLAAAATVSARATWGDDPIIVIVEPDAAPALQASIEEGRAVLTDGPVSNMGRLDCKDPSHLALKRLAADADYFMTIRDEDATECVHFLSTNGLQTTPSGAAGVAGLFAACRSPDQVKLTPKSRVLCYLSEGPEDG